MVRYINLPEFGVLMRLAWRKHRLRSVSLQCPKKTFSLGDHRIAAKNYLLTTRAAKWATVQVGTGRTVKEVAGELACNWHTDNDAVTTYGKALLEADRKRMNKTSAIGLDETKSLPPTSASDYSSSTATLDTSPNNGAEGSRGGRETAAASPSNDSGALVKRSGGRSVIHRDIHARAISASA